MDDAARNEPAPDALLSPELAQRGVGLRPATDDDRAFVSELYVSHRWAEMAVTGWPEDARRTFLEDQARLQAAHYAHHYHDAQFLIITVDGTAAGRLYLFHRNATDLRIVEIGLVPAFQGQGIGTALLRRVQEIADSAGKSCSIHVEAQNPARRLYSRLGFVEAGEHGPYRLMEWRR